jgi:hypothetical protein
MASEENKRIYDFWFRLSQKEHSADFRSFMLFRIWALSNGYSAGAVLDRFDESKPYSPENCFWQSPEEKNISFAAHSAAAWDRLVDGIRVKNGLPPILSTNPCIGCEKERICGDGVCNTRLRYWDASMRKLRIMCNGGGK